MSERRQQILQSAIDIITDEGYGSLSMRGLARASGVKLGALQYHFRTRADMLRAVVGYIAEAYRQTFDSMRKYDGSIGLKAFVEGVCGDPAQGKLRGNKLWPQLWAMGQVEPLVAELVDDIYAEYMRMLEELLKDLGNPKPRTEALLLMSLIEGSTIFVAPGKRWENDLDSLFEFMYRFIEDKYGKLS